MRMGYEWQYWLARMERNRRIEIRRNIAFWASLAVFAAIVIMGLVK